MSYQKYSTYKNSGIELPERLPIHWGLSKLRYIGSFGKGLTITKENLQDEGVPCVNYGEVHSKFGFQIDTKLHALKCVSEEFLKNNPDCLLTKGDIIFADTSEDLDGSGNFTQLMNDDIVFAGYHTIVFHPFNGIDKRYLAYLLDSQDFRTQIKKLVKGVKVFSITQSILRSASVWLPSLEEQFRIASFLDQEIDKIDRLIDKQERLISLLKEKKLSVICRAVTKGVDPNAKLKKSGFEWLGDIPTHWEIKPLRYLGTCQNGINIGAEYFGNGYPFVSYGDVYNNNTLPVQVNGLVESSEKDRDVYSVSHGDVLFTRTSETIEEIGFSSTALADIPDATFAGFLIRFRPYAGYLYPEYSMRYFSCVLLRAFFIKEMNLVTRASLSQELLKKLPVTVPPLAEQQEIAIFLRKQIGLFDSLINKSKEAIVLLKERRSSLISSAVTGKIDVRNCQPDAKDVA